MSTSQLNIKEVNARFLLALDFINPKARRLGEGTAGGHPNLRTSLLHDFKLDIQFDGLEKAVQKWQNFLKGGKK